MNIILTGFMGSGKTTIGIRLSYRMKQPFLDTDKNIERLEEMTITEIFDRFGEAGFRQKETDMLQGMVNSRLKDHIISTGGGMPVREENRALLKKLGVVVWLRLSPEAVYERLKNDTTRPLLQGSDPENKIRELMKSREAFYRDGADVIVDVEGKTIERIMDEIFTKSRGVWKYRKKELYK